MPEPAMERVGKLWTGFAVRASRVFVGIDLTLRNTSQGLALFSCWVLWFRCTRVSVGCKLR